MERPVLVCEPQCWGFEHSRANAALLATALLAYPGREIVFLGEQEHVRWVQQAARDVPGIDTGRVRWERMKIPPRTLGGWKRVRRELPWCRELLATARHARAEFILLCSLTPTALLVLKFLLGKNSDSPVMVAIPHGILASVLEAQPRAPWRWALGMRQLLRLPHPPALKLIALGEPIYRHLRQAGSGLVRPFVPMDLPYIWARSSVPEGPGIGDPICLGYVGASTKGFQRFYEVAASLAALSESVRFVLAGFVDHPDEIEQYRALIEGIGARPLPEEEYARRISGLTYIVWTGDPRHYRLAASATFLDALSHVRPGIYLRNPYVEYYFEKMGDIGYLCDSLEEMVSLIERLSKDFPRERYFQQCQAILLGRDRFSPAVVAPRLRSIVEGNAPDRGDGPVQGMDRGSGRGTRPAEEKG